MGNIFACDISGNKQFDALKFPSYCVLDSATHDDVIVVLECWLWCVRTRRDFKPGATSFTHMQTHFYNLLADLHIDCQKLKDVNFFIMLIGTLVHGKFNNEKTHMRFKSIKVDTEIYSAAGRVLLAVLETAYEPKVWTTRLRKSWIRCYSALMRNVLSEPKTLKDKSKDVNTP